MAGDVSSGDVYIPADIGDISYSYIGLFATRASLLRHFCLAYPDEILPFLAAADYLILGLTSSINAI
jgi:hypothetical protein